MDQRRQKIFILAVLAFAVAVYLGLRFGRENDESRVRKAVYAGVVAVEGEDIMRLASLIDETYIDGSGNDKAAVLRLALALFRDFRDFRLEVKRLKIEVRGPEADAEASFKLFFKKNAEEELYYDAGQLKLSFVRRAQGWCVTSSEYLGTDQILFLPVVAQILHPTRSEA